MNSSVLTCVNETSCLLTCEQKSEMDFLYDFIFIFSNMHSYEIKQFRVKKKKRKKHTIFVLVKVLYSRINRRSRPHGNSTFFQHCRMLNEHKYNSINCSILLFNEILKKKNFFFYLMVELCRIISRAENLNVSFRRVSA